jgi:hypothetical protein
MVAERKAPSKSDSSFLAFQLAIGWKVVRLEDNLRSSTANSEMLTRLQKAAMLGALAIFFTAAWVGEIWQASNIPPSSINQNAGGQKGGEAKPETSKESTDEAIARYNKWLTIFTAVLAIATIGLGTATVGLYFASERQIEIWRRSTEATERAALAATEQAHVARIALTQLERPYLFIFGVHHFQFDSETKEYFVEYTVANYGKMPAIIESPGIEFVIDNGGQPPLPTHVEESHSLMTSPIMPAGEQRVFREYLPTGMTDGGIVVEVVDAVAIVSHPNITLEDDFDLYFRAVIRYRGPSSGNHVTGALWWYNIPGNEFLGRGGEEYNYVS